MGIYKPSVAGKPPIIVASSTQGVSAACELVAAHYTNLTAGAGRVNLRDGGAAGEIRVVMSSDAANGNDGFEPSQPAKFLKGIYVEFATGTGVVTLLVN